MKAKVGQGSATGKPTVAAKNSQAGSGTVSTPNATALKLQSYSVRACHIKAYVLKKGGS